MPAAKLQSGQKINYKFDKGRTETAIVFIHGLGANLTVWQKEHDCLKEKGYSVLSFDLPCHGYSSCRQNTRFRHFSACLNLLFKKLKIKRSVLVGHSIGGLVAFDYYQRFPKDVAAIISIDSSYKLSLETLNPLMPLQFFIFKLFALAAGRKKIAHRHIDFQKISEKSDLEIKYEMESSMNFALHSGLISDMLDIDFFSILEKISIPVLVVASSDDEFFRVSVTKEMAHKIPMGHFQKISGTHSIILKQPVKISHVIESFIKREAEKINLIG